MKNSFILAMTNFPKAIPRSIILYIYIYICELPYFLRTFQWLETYYNTEYISPKDFQNHKTCAISKEHIFLLHQNFLLYLIHLSIIKRNNFLSDSQKNVFSFFSLLVVVKGRPFTCKTIDVHIVLIYIFDCKIIGYATFLC